MTVELFARNQLYDHVLRVLVPRQDRLGPAEEIVLLKALFSTGQIDAFQWRVPIAEMETSNPTLIAEKTELLRVRLPSMDRGGATETRISFGELA